MLVYTNIYYKKTCLVALPFPAALNPTGDALKTRFGVPFTWRFRFGDLDGEEDCPTLASYLGNDKLLGIPCCLDALEGDFWSFEIPFTLRCIPCCLCWFEDDISPALETLEDCLACRLSDMWSLIEQFSVWISGPLT